MPEGALEPSPAAVLQARLAPYLKRPLAEVVLTENRQRIFSVRDGEGGGVRLRIHRGFVEAPTSVLAQVCILVNQGPAGSHGWAKTRAQALRTVRSFFAETVDREPPQRLPTLRPQGRHIDLRCLCDVLNRRYFEGHLAVEITWGRRVTTPRRRRVKRRSIRLGSYHPTLRLVRVHPVLDSPDVPRFVVAAVVYHELLHAAMPPEMAGHRRRVHTPDFRRREAAYPDHHRAQAWLDQHLDDLFRRRHRSVG